MDMSTQPVEPTGPPEPVVTTESAVASNAATPSISDTMAQFLEPTQETVATQPVPASPQATPAEEMPIATDPPVPVQPPEAPTSLVSDLPPISVQQAPLKAESVPMAATQPDVAPAAPVITSAEPLAGPGPDIPALSYEPTDIDDRPMLSSAGAGMPDAMQMELDQPSGEEPKEGLSTRKVGKTVVGVFIVVLAGLLIKNNSTTLGTHKLKSKGYAYNFKFYRHSSQFSYGDGAAGFKHANDGVVGSARPTANQDITTCTKVGNGWKEAFNVTINGTSVPVCTPDSMTYVIVFNGAGHEQQLTISYPTVQKPDTFPILKTMFASVSVKK